MANRWYCVQAKQHCEFMAVRMLKTGGYEPLMLTEVVTRTSAYNVKRECTVSLFGSYFFVPFDVELDNWRPITNTYGVKRILSSTPESPTPIPDGVVEQLIQCSIQPQQPDNIIPIMPGCTVKVISGPLANPDVVGICEMRSGDRVTLLLQAMYGELRVIFDVSSLELVP